MHNKKRNAGLLYEFLVRHMSNALLHNEMEKHSQAYKIALKHFSSGTELYREFRVFNALIQTNGLSEGVASRIISEAKSAICAQDDLVLEREKSVLIKDINYTCGKGVYKYKVPNYKKFATIQQIFNEWRKPNADLGRLAKFEQQLHQWLLESKPPQAAKTLDEHLDSNVSDLVLRIANKKLTEKYAKHLTGEQCAIMNDYIMANDPAALIERLQKLRTEVLAAVDSKLRDQRFCEAKDIGSFVADKLQDVRAKIVLLEGKPLDDTSITRHLRLIELRDELEEYK